MGLCVLTLLTEAKLDGYYLAILSNAEHRVLIVAELHAVHLSIMSLPAHCTLIALHI